MQKTRTNHEHGGEEPGRTWVATVADLGHAGLGLRTPIIVTMEDFGEEVVASYPEVEAFGSGRTEADAINALKDEVSSLYAELASTPENELGKLPRRWKRALCAVAYPTGV